MGRGNVAQSSISADGHRQTWTKSPIDDAYQASAAPIKTSDICQRGKGASFPRPPVTPKQDTVDCSDSAPYFVHSKPSPRCPFLSSVLTGLSVVQTPPETGFFLTSKGLRYGPSLSCQGFDAPLHIVTPDNRRHGDSNHDEAATSTTPEFLELENPNSARKRTPRPSSRETGIHVYSPPYSSGFLV
ncbi:conserved hypothetical protein [Coccidioides posadasii str. Silveira]|uniref:Uncharacterized protein n=1 Tax=Coccidioides posadasii (strain RMSCC 757 / Silveira) TaxID=443226 RepID=E9CU75_COCPS|nr:conserved hypothetical protein [Coccidioides posadasii str. Silveira]